MRAALAFGTAAALLSALAAPAAAQSRGYAVNRLDPAEPGGDWYTTESLDLRGSLLVRASVVGDWAYRPLRVNGPLGGEHRVIADQIFMHLRTDVVIADRFRVGIGLPVALYQDGDAVWAGRTPRHAERDQAFGDLRLVGDVRVFGTFTDRVRGAAGLVVHAPTGDRDSYTSDGLVRLAPRFMLAGALGAFDWAARVGYLHRPYERIWEGRALGDDLTFGASAGVRVNDRFVLGPELVGAATATGPDAFGPRSVWIELLIGARARLANDFQVGSAIGGAVTHADGAPKMRVLATFEYAPDVCVDKDGDGICAYEDACPDVDGVRTLDRKTNGCPADRDRDGIPDRDDKCPDESGRASVDPQTVGCPDRDRDGIVDRWDACPDLPGETSSEPASNGCPGSGPAPTPTE